MMWGWFVILLQGLLITVPVYSETSILQKAGEWQTDGMPFTSEDVQLLTDTDSMFFFNLEFDLISDDLSLTQDDITSELQTQFPISIANKTIIFLSAEVMTECTIYPQELNCSCGSMYTFPPNVCSLHGCDSPLNSPCTCASIHNPNVTMLNCEPTVHTTMAPTLTTHFSTSTMSYALKACLSTPMVLQTPTEASVTSTFPSTYKLEVAATINLTINMDFIPEFNNASSREFKCLKKLSEELLTNTYKRIPGFAKVEILGFSNGSVKIKYQVKGNNITDEDIFNKTSVELRRNLLEKDILSIKLPVIEKIGIIKSPPQHQVYEVGKTAVLSCFYPTTVHQHLRWWKNNKIISNKSDWEKSNLKATDSGIYICDITANNTRYVDNVDIHIVEFPKNIKTTNVSLNPQESGNVSCCLIDWPDQNIPFNVTWHDSSGNLLRKEVMEGNSSTKCTILMVNNTQHHENELEMYICTFSISPFNVSGEVIAEFHTQYTFPTTPPANVTRIKIIAPEGEIKESDDVRLTCEMPIVTTPPIWRIDGSSITSGSTFKINQINNRTSQLEIKGIKPAYEGEYSCSAVQDLKTYEAKHTLNGVIAKPRIINSTLPFTQTCGANVSLECCVTSLSPTNISWTWKMVTNEGTIKNNCSSFKRQIQNPCLQNENVICVFTNVAGRAQENITISIISENESFCNQTSMGDYKWEKTKAGSMAYQHCPVGTEGKVSHLCNKEKWTGDIIENCTSKEFQEIHENTKRLQDGIGNATDTIKELFTKLHNLTNMSQGNLYLGDIEAASEVLDILTSVSEDNGIIITDDTMKEMVMITDALVNEEYSDLWQKINENSKLGGSKILKSLEGLTKLYVPNQDDFSILARNIELKGKRFVNPEGVFQQKFPDTSVLIPSQFLSSKNIVVTSIYLSTMSKILPRRFPTSDKNYSVGSAVLSTVITDNDNNNDNSSMEITMAFTIFSSNSNPYESLCSFWNYNAGNGEWSSTGCKETVEGNQTTCTCSHLTSFSVLISPKTVTSLGLEIITYVGVGISIGALIIALIIEFLIWRFVKKDQLSKIRHIILVNICVTLIFADIWFLLAASPLAKESFCIAVTFLMHFFYMGLFFWMLCEGSFLFYKVVFPFHFATSTIIIRYLFIVGYACPTIIAVTTIAVTQPRNIYTREGTCWLNWDQSRALLAFVIPAFIIVGINFIFLMVVLYKICTQGRMGVSTNNDDTAKLQRILRSLIIKMPVLGTTWGIGVFAFAPGAEQNEGLHYAFAILNAFQGLLILIVDFMMDKAVLKALTRVICGHSWVSNATSSSQSPQSVGLKIKAKSKTSSTVPKKYTPL